MLKCRVFFFSSRRRHTRCSRDWSSDVCSSDLKSVDARDLNLHGGCPPRDFKSLASTDFATPAGLKYPFAPHPARRLHHVNRRLASVRGTECAPNLARYLRLILPTFAFALPQQDEHRTAPSGTGDSGAERARPPRRRDDRIQLGRAAVVEPPAGFVGLIQQLTEALQVPPGQQLRAE